MGQFQGCLALRRGLAIMESSQNIPVWIDANPSQRQPLCNGQESKDLQQASWRSWKEGSKVKIGISCEKGEKTSQPAKTTWKEGKTKGDEGGPYPWEET